jgi:hypothetical protein
MCEVMVMEVIKYVNDHKVGIHKNGEYRIVAENLTWAEARSIARFLRIFGHSSYYTSWSNIC